MKTFFEELFAYSFHCNQQLAVALHEQSKTINTKSIDIFSHVLNAHHIWNNRILGRPVKYRVWERHAVEVLAALDQQNYEESLAVLYAVDLTAEIKYKTGGGQPFTNTARDVLFHIINHSTYHRGQLALLFRQNGIDPVGTDYIAYKR